ncbi:MAG: UDP-N-acetylmuramate--L-alanine ligase [Tenericutes bacterium]|nr:UDP-N-acetylmuramate--L-alanine ligase [Mycoplasmatota bacterium]MDD6942138.1 Mur ligase family protein [bacterium]MDY2697756.1 Mur ligase family protein [Bacilli bacterium]
MKYYCIGIKGTGMSTLAQILSDLGNDVSGYDDAKGHKFTQDGLEARNIPIYYDGNHEISPDTIVTYSVAFKEDHPEMQRVKSLGLTIKKYNEIMGDVIDEFSTVGVSGTHGKTTTSSIIRHLLENTVGCNYFIGAGDGHATRENKYYVVESDEFNRHFTAYHPTYSIITNIEAEHLECYKDIDDIRSTFEIFANQTKKLIVANGDNEEVRKINYKTKVLFYGFNENNDIVIKNVYLAETGSSFDLYINNELYGHFSIPLYGKHMVMDAAAAITMVKEIGLEKDTIEKILKTFKNAKRRFAEQRVGESIIIDDYAHHPTEIKVTLEAVKQKYPNKRLVVVFVPNTYSRTRDFKDEFIEAFKIADKTYLTEIDCNREKPEDYPGISSSIIISGLESGEIISESTIDKLLKEKDSVVCFMGCAYVDGLINAYKEELQKN